MRRVKEIKKVTEAVYKVLEVLWESSEMMTVNQIMEELRKKGTIWANRTILVFLNNLEKKEAVSKQKQKITYYYYPIIAKKEFVMNESKNFLQKYFSGSLKGFLSMFTADNDSITEEEWKELQDWVNKFDK